MFVILYGEIVSVVGPTNSFIWFKVKFETFSLIGLATIGTAAKLSLNLVVSDA